MTDKEDHRLDQKLDPNSTIPYIALSILCASQNSLVPELLYLFSPKQIINFIKVFSGETIKVPTVDEFSRVLNTALACYHVIIEGKSWDWFKLKYQVDGNYVNGIQLRLDSWLRSLNDSEREFIEHLKAQEYANHKGKERIRELVREGTRNA